MVDPKNAGQALIDAGSSGLWVQLEGALQEKLELSPEDPNLLEALGQIYRKKGDLAAAAAIYGRLKTVLPDRVTAAYLSAVLKQGTLPVSAAVRTPWPTPFVRIPDFLSPQDHDRLLEIAREHQSDFVQLKVYSQEGRELREGEQGVRAQIGLKGNLEVPEIMKPSLVEALPMALPRLQIEAFDMGFFSAELSLSRDGHFALAHQDDHQGRFKVSFAYYLCRQPKSFSGGDLLLYDTDTEKRQFQSAQFTRVKHTDNCLLLFPSAYFHQITRVSCPTNEFDLGRFAVAGLIGP